MKIKSAQLESRVKNLSLLNTFQHYHVQEGITNWTTDELVQHMPCCFLNQGTSSGSRVWAFAAGLPEIEVEMCGNLLSSQRW